jgi:hypothetical protein
MDTPKSPSTNEGNSVIFDRDGTEVYYAKLNEIGAERQNNV